eukprot:11381-Heterococcus_DN1.PRE.1
MNTSAHKLLPIVLLELHTATLVVLILWYCTVSNAKPTAKAAHFKCTVQLLRPICCSELGASLLLMLLERSCHEHIEHFKYTEASYERHDVLFSFLCMSAAHASHTRHYFTTETAAAATTAAAAAAAATTTVAATSSKL